MGFLKWLLWTSFSIGLGIFLATYDVGGQTPWARLRSVWSSSEAPERLEKLKGGVSSALEDARFAAGRSDGNKPREHHSTSERDQVNKLIAKKAGGQ